MCCSMFYKYSLRCQKFSRLRGKKEENSEKTVERFVQTSPPGTDVDATSLTLESSFIEQSQEAVKYKV